MTTLVVETANSTYTFDMAARTVTRAPMSGDLRRDAEPIPLLAMTDLVVGRRLGMLLDLRGDGVRTYRETSPVLRITEEFYEDDEPIEDILKAWDRREEP